MGVKHYEVRAYTARTDGKYDITKSTTTGARLTNIVLDFIGANKISYLTVDNGQTDIFVTVDTKPYRVFIRTKKVNGAMDKEFNYITALYKAVRGMSDDHVSHLDSNNIMCHEVCSFGDTMPDCLSCYIDELCHEVCSFGVTPPDCLSCYIDELVMPKDDELICAKPLAVMVCARSESPMAEVRPTTSAEHKWLSRVYDKSCAVQINRYIHGSECADLSLPYDEIFREPILFICDWIDDEDYDKALSCFKTV